MKPQLIFVCGPYRADTDNERNKNIEAARAVAVEVWRKGHYALCPHLNSAFMSGVCDEAQFLDGAKEMLRQCGAVVLVSDMWHTSQGALDEYDTAVINEITLYDSITDVPQVDE